MISVRDEFHHKVREIKSETQLALWTNFTLEQAVKTVTTKLSNLLGKGSDAQLWMYHIFLMKLYYVYYKISHIVYLKNKHLIYTYFVKILH